MPDYVGNCTLLRICRLILDCSAVHAVAFSQWICKPDSAGNRMLLQICNGALEPCFCGFCMQLHFCNSFISLKNAIKKLWKKYQCVSDAILCHHCKFQIFPSLDSLFMQYRVNCQWQKMRPMNCHFRAYEVCMNVCRGLLQRGRWTGVQPLNLVIIHILHHHLSDIMRCVAIWNVY